MKCDWLYFFHLFPQLVDKPKILKNLENTHELTGYIRVTILELQF